MKKILILLFISFILVSCFKTKKSNNTKELKKEVNKELNKPNLKKEYFSNIKDFKEFINKKWVNTEIETPCDPENRSIEINGDYLIDETGMEAFKCEILNIKKINSSTFEFEIIHDCSYGDTFKVEILDYNNRLVKWSFYNGIYYEARPNDLVCKEYEDLQIYKKPKDVKTPLKWIGKYYFEEEGIGHTIIISKKEMIYESVGIRYYHKYKLSANQVKDTLALYYHKGLSGNEDALEKYLPLIRMYKNNEHIYIKSVLTKTSYAPVLIEKY